MPLPLAIYSYKYDFKKSSLNMISDPSLQIITPISLKSTFCCIAMLFKR